MALRLNVSYQADTKRTLLLTADVFVSNEGLVNKPYDHHANIKISNFLGTNEVHESSKLD